MEDSKVLYEIMICADGVSRAVPFINGNKIDTASEAIKLLDGLSRKGYRLKVEMIDLNGEVSAYFF